jgi:hypothetical protein
MRNLDDGTDDGTDGWKGRPPPDRLRILYKKIYSATSDGIQTNVLSNSSNWGEIHSSLVFRSILTLISVKHHHWSFLNFKPIWKPTPSNSHFNENHLLDNHYYK